MREDSSGALCPVCSLSYYEMLEVSCSEKSGKSYHSFLLLTPKIFYFSKGNMVCLLNRAAVQHHSAGSPCFVWCYATQFTFPRILHYCGHEQRGLSLTLSSFKIFSKSKPFFFVWGCLPWLTVLYPLLSCSLNPLYGLYFKAIYLLLELLYFPVDSKHLKGKIYFSFSSQCPAEQGLA